MVGVAVLVGGFCVGAYSCCATRYSLGPSSNIKARDVYDGLPTDENPGTMLGSGGTSRVYKVTHKHTHTECALKVRALDSTRPEWTR